MIQKESIEYIDAGAIIIFSKNNPDLKEQELYIKFFLTPSEIIDIYNKRHKILSREDLIEECRKDNYKIGISKDLEFYRYTKLIER